MWTSNNLICRFLTLIFGFVPNSVLAILIRWFRNCEGNFGFNLRHALYKNLCAYVGQDVKFFPYLIVLFPEKLSIGNKSTLHEFSVIECKGGVSIGESTSIAHKFSLLSSNHRFSLPGISYREQGLESKITSIGDHVWIGAGVIVTAGAKIGSYSVVGAQTVVNKVFEGNSLIVGVPGKVIKKIC